MLFAIMAIVHMHIKSSSAASSIAMPETLVTVLNDPDLYNKHATPTQDTDTPTVVNISMYIEGISSFRATSMDFQLDIYFQQRWIDERLRHDNKRHILIKDPTIFQKMWRPDLYFANARAANFHHVTEPNFVIWIHNNGSIYYESRISLTVICMQNFAKYPMDEQECSLRILSYAYDVEQLNLTWTDSADAILRDPDIVMADMILVSVTPQREEVDYPTGVWAMATARVYVRREIMHHILQTYMPTSLIVIISWFSFWLGVDSVPGRVSLSITTLLTLTTQANSARMALPQVSYIKAIDVWMGTCMAFVFGAMIEFNIVNYLARRKKPFGFCCSTGHESRRNLKRTHSRLSHSQRHHVCTACDGDNHLWDTKKKLNGRIESPVRKLPPSHPGLNNKRSTTVICGVYAEFHAPDKCEACKKRQLNLSRTASEADVKPPVEFPVRKLAQKIDETSRWAFPMTFFVFNVFYWPFYKYLEVSKKVAP